MKITSLLLFCSLLFVISCSTDSKPKALFNWDTIQENEGFLDLPLSIVDKKTVDGYIQYRAQAKSKGDSIELLVSLKKDVPPGFVNGQPKNMFLPDGIIFESTGAKSDLLFNMLCDKYGVKKYNLSIKDKQVFTAANLNQNKVSHSRGAARFKIFLEEETDYAELFVNFDFDKNKIHLSEKDPEYRKGLITLMTK